MVESKDVKWESSLTLSKVGWHETGIFSFYQFSDSELLVANADSGHKLSGSGASEAIEASKDNIEITLPDHMRCSSLIR